jgi:hypothetical protein
MKFAQREREGGQNSGPALASALKHCFVLNFCFFLFKQKEKV